MLHGRPPSEDSKNGKGKNQLVWGFVGHGLECLLWQNGNSQKSPVHSEDSTGCWGRREGRTPGKPLQGGWWFRPGQWGCRKGPDLGQDLLMDAMHLGLGGAEKSKDDSRYCLEPVEGVNGLFAQTGRKH